ncbi:MAG: biopolymer transporter ExbD [Verrucomicrobiae bacterium]|nr:biopolymer transporter ExbD [Verrucomicrobiae bacterium]
MVTLSEINITPLLDLAFVLLIIFIITTPLLTQSVDLKLPNGGKPDMPLTKRDIRTVEITSLSQYRFEGGEMRLRDIITDIARDYRSNPRLVVYIRADKACRYELVANLLDGCQKYGISRYSLRMDPTPPK